MEEIKNLKAEVLARWWVEKREKKTNATAIFATSCLTAAEGVAAGWAGIREQFICSTIQPITFYPERSGAKSPLTPKILLYP